ncbi:MAG: zinc ABC transporter substrate-binding protein [Planctomycetota bacterium]
MNGSRSTLLSTFLALLVTAGCSVEVPPSSPDDDGGVKARAYPIACSATIGMVADIVRNVGGDHVAVDQLMGPGVDPHLHKPTSDDVRRITQADMVFYCGLMLEGKMADSLIKVARRKPVVAVTEMIEETSLLEPEEMEGYFDPHVWNDVAAWQQCVGVVAESLAEFDPQHREDYRSNAADYQAKLEALHAYGQQSLGSIPVESRVLITSHDAFNYFGRAYGLDVMGVQGLSTESEAGLQRINALVDLLVDRKVRAVFVESSVPPDNIEALVEGAASRGHNVIVGGELYSDAMGKGGTYEGTYVGMLDHNITLVTRALGGEAPALGFQGKLASQAEPVDSGA